MWTASRDEMIAVFGNDLSIENIIKEILGDADKWEIFASLCETIMRNKEERERE